MSDASQPQTEPGTVLKLLYGTMLLSLLAIALIVTGWIDQGGDKEFLIRTIGPLLAVILVIALSGRKFQNAPLPPLPMLAIALILTQVFSLIGVTNIGVALAAITRQIGLVAFFFLARYYARFPAYRNGMLLTLVIIGIATSIYGIAQHFGYDFINWQEHREVPTHRGTSFMGHATFAASVLIMLLPISAVLLLDTSSKFIRALCAIAFALMLYHLSFTAARVATAALVLAATGGIAAFVLHRNQSSSHPINKTWVIIGSAVILLLGGLLVNRAWQAKDSDPLGLLEGGMAQRLFAWETANRMLLANPVNGVGVGNYEIASPPDWNNPEQVRFSLYRRALYQPHNEYIETAAETGVPGIICLLGIIAIAISRCWSGITQEPRLYAGFLIALLASALDAAFLFPWQVPVSAVIFWVILGLIDGTIPNETAPKPEAAAPSPTHS